MGDGDDTMTLTSTTIGASPAKEEDEKLARMRTKEARVEASMLKVLATGSREGVCQRDSRSSAVEGPREETRSESSGQPVYRRKSLINQSIGDLLFSARFPVSYWHLSVCFSVSWSVLCVCFVVLLLSSMLF